MQVSRSGNWVPMLLAALLVSTALPVLADDATPITPDAKPAAETATPVAEAAKPVAEAAKPVAQNDDLDAVLWDQTSVEAQAASIGAYDLGKLRLDEALANTAWTAASEQTGHYESLPPAIILDVDDTVVNTSAYQAWTVTAGTEYGGKTWDNYVKAEKDVPIAGALDFLDYAAAHGVTIFYVTNRTEPQEAPTVEEMKKLGFPMGDGSVDTFLASGERPDWTSAKSTRRAFIAKNYRVVLLFGDNMGDFTDDINGTVAQREAVFKQDAAHWGHDWIQISNPTYGSWQSAPFLSDYKDNNDDQQRQKEEQALTPWSGPAQ